MPHTRKDPPDFLSSSDRLRRLLIESAAYAVIATDVRGYITLFNAAAEELLGYRAAELIGLETPEIFHDPNGVAAGAAALSEELQREIKPGFEVFVAKTTFTKNPEERGWTYLRKDGSRVPVRLSVTAITEDSGEVVGYLGIARDVSELNRAEAILLAQEARLRTIYHSAIDAIFVVDRAGIVLDLNPAAERIFGFSRAFLLGKNCRLLIVDGSSDEEESCLSRYLIPGTGRGQGGVHEVVARRADGSNFSAEFSLAEGRDGRELIGTLRDISERRAAEAERARLTLILEESPDYVLMADFFGVVRHANRAARTLFAVPASSFGKKTLAELLPGVFLESQTTRLRQLIDAGGYSSEVVVNDAVGAEIPVHLATHVHRDFRGEPEFVSLTMRDLREQKRSEGLLAKVAGHLPGMLYKYLHKADGTSCFPYASLGIVDIFGVSPEQARASADFVLTRIHPEDRERVRTGIMASAETGGLWTAEYRYQHPDGRLLMLHGSAKSERHPDGSVAWYGFVTDVTDRHRQEEQYRALRENLEDAIASLDAGFAMFDAEQRLVVNNARYAEMYRIPPEILVPGSSFEEILRRHAEVTPEVFHSFSGHHDLDAAIAERLREQLDPGLNRLHHIDDRWIRVDERRTRRGGTVSLRTDITAIKQAEEEARMQEDRLRLATASLRLGIWEYEPDGGALRWDERMIEMYGYPSGTLRVTYAEWRDRVHPEDLTRVEAELAFSIAEKRPFIAKFRLLLPGGVVRVIDARSAVVRGTGGEVRKLIGVNVDITDEVESEARLREALRVAEEATKVKAKFLATMSHEIRTPMNGVIGMANLLAKTKLESEQREFVDAIRSSGESLLRLINDILDFSKMEAGKLELEVIPLSLKQIVGEVVLLFGEEAERKGLELKVDYQGEVEQLIVGDPTRVRQVVLNLASNAIKFTHKGSVTLALSVAKENATARIALAVRDTGIGMTEAQKARLGEAFSQADSSTTRRYGGTGLGLSICQSLVQLMGGELSVRSTLGEGTEFIVLWSATTVERSAALSAPSSRREPLRYRLGKVLVAEDNVINQRIIGIILREHADTVVTVENGQLALERFKTDSFDLVLMDGQMPVMDGKETTRAIREFERLTARKRTPIFALTANALPGDREDFLAAGMDDYFSKPLRESELLKGLARMNSLRDEEQESVWENFAVRDLYSSLRGIMSDREVKDLAEAGLVALPQLLEEGREALSASDYRRLRRVAHNMNGSAAVLGILELSQVCSDLESYAHSGDAAKIAAVVDAWQRATASTVQLLQDLLKTAS